MLLAYTNKKTLLFSLILTLIFGGFFVFSPASLAWTEPTGEPPGGNIAAPINVSSTTQTKTGSLIIGDATQGTLGLYPKAAAPANPSEGQIYYNSTDKAIYYYDGTAWQPVGAGASGNYVQLNPTTPPQSGFLWLEGRSEDLSNYMSAIKGTAALPTGTEPSAGIEGQSYASIVPTGNKSYGVFGYANTNEPTSFAIYGSDTGKPNAYAGYFKGNVAVESSGAGITSLTLKSNTNLCFEGDCIDEWADISGSGSGSVYWTLNASDIHPSDNTYNLAVGGTASDDANTVFYVNTDNKGSVVIGQPEDLTIPPGLILTCPDGTCNSTESGDSASADYCDADCATVFNAGNPLLSSISNNTASIVWGAKEEHWAKFEYGKTTNFELGTVTPQPLVSPPAPDIAYQADLIGLEESTKYYYKVTIWDETDATDIRDTEVYQSSFTTSVDSCGNSICEAGETCATCPSDCGCSGGQNCCGDETCKECCIDADCSPPTDHCIAGTCVECQIDGDCTDPAKPYCSGNTCVRCTNSAQCGGDGYVCCDNLCYEGDCCQTPDCLSGKKCCADLWCRNDCRGVDEPPVVQLSLPLAYQSKEDQSTSKEKQGQVLGVVSKLSQSLLIPEAKAKSELFKNIIPVASAAAPFDALNNRKLTAYGGVITVVNGNATATHALEIGGAINDGLSISSTDKIYFRGSTNNDVMIIDTVNERVGINQSTPLAALHVEPLNNGVRPLRLVTLNNDQIEFLKAGGNTAPHTFLDRSDVGYRFWDASGADTGSIMIMTPITGANIGGNVGIGTDSAQARLVVNNPKTGGKVGSSGDAVYAYADSGNAAISAEQTGAGWAGYFAGKVTVTGGNLEAGTICLSGDCKNAWPSSALSGSGTTNQVVKWTGGTSLGDSLIYDTGTNVGIGQNSPSAKLTVNNNISNAGSSNDAIFAAANRSSGAAISALQTGSGYAGYFSGRTEAYRNYTGSTNLNLATPQSAFEGVFDSNTGGGAGVFGFVQNCGAGKECAGVFGMSNPGWEYAGIFQGRVKFHGPSSGQSQFTFSGGNVKMLWEDIEGNPYTEVGGTNLFVQGPNATVSDVNTYYTRGIGVIGGNVAGNNISYAIHAKAGTDNINDINTYAGYFEGKIAVESLSNPGRKTVIDTTTGTHIWSTNDILMSTAFGAVTLQAGASDQSSFKVWKSGAEKRVDIDGNLYATSKSFQISHPLDSSKNLIHASLEGPENAVYYRGESQLDFGQTVVLLPDYFEELTLKEGRTVMLTPKFDEGMEISNLAASDVSDGKFIVKTIDNKNLFQEFYWEVKAVRADIEPLKAEVYK